jgi:hypothetical protein
MVRANGIRSWRILCFAALLFALRAADASDADCLKRVFDRYCLGGSLDALLNEAPRPDLDQVDGERRALVFQGGPELDYVLAFRDRIYKVVRRYRAATQLRYDDLYGLLRDKYGPGEDHSRFPPYASTASRRLGSIRRGDGRAVHVWKPDETWHLELSWTRELDIAVAYVATALDAEQDAAVQRGF